jgi:hypothetical protein
MNNLFSSGNKRAGVGALAGARVASDHPKGAPIGETIARTLGMKPAPVVASPVPAVRALSSEERLGRTGAPAATPVASRFVTFEELAQRTSSGKINAAVPLGHDEEGHSHHASHHRQHSGEHHHYDHPHHQHHQQGNYGSGSKSSKHQRRGSDSDGESRHRHPSQRSGSRSRSASPGGGDSPSPRGSRGGSPVRTTTGTRESREAEAAFTPTRSSGSVTELATGKVVTIDATKLPIAKAASPASMEKPAAPAAAKVSTKVDTLFVPSATLLDANKPQDIVGALRKRKSKEQYQLTVPGEGEYEQDIVALGGSGANTRDFAALVNGIAGNKSAQKLSVFSDTKNYTSGRQQVTSEPLGIRSGGNNLLARNAKPTTFKYRSSDKSTPPIVVIHYAALPGRSKQRLMKKTKQKQAGKKAQGGATTQNIFKGEPVILNVRSPLDNKTKQLVVSADGLVVTDTNNDPVAKAKVWVARYLGSDPTFPMLVVMRFAAGDFNASWTDLVLVYDNTGERATFKATESPLLGSEMALVQSLSALTDEYIVTSVHGGTDAAADVLEAYNSLIRKPLYGDSVRDVSYARTLAGSLSACVRQNADDLGVDIGAVHTELNTTFDDASAETKVAAEAFSAVVAEVASDYASLNLTPEEVAWRAGNIYDAVFRHIDAPNEVLAEDVRAAMSDDQWDAANADMTKLALRSLGHACSHLILKTGASKTTLSALWGAKSGLAQETWTAQFGRF